MWKRSVVVINLQRVMTLQLCFTLTGFIRCFISLLSGLLCNFTVLAHPHCFHRILFGSSRWKALIYQSTSCSADLMVTNWRRSRQLSITAKRVTMPQEIWRLVIFMQCMRWASCCRSCTLLLCNNTTCIWSRNIPTSCNDGILLQEHAQVHWAL